MKRVLLLAPYFPPRRRVGSYRAFKFAIHLRKFGWEPVVVHLKEKKSRLSSREHEFLRGIQCIELGTPLDRTSSSSGSYAASANNSNRPVPNNNAIGNFLDQAFPVDTWWPVLKYHQKTMQRLVEDFKPHVLWSTADPWSSHLSAMRLAETNRIPWVADFRDPWTLCRLRSVERMFWAKAIDRRTEKKILSRADHVIFTAENTTKRYREHYADLKTAMSTIYNSFDDAFFMPRDQKKEQNTGKFKLLFYGRFRSLSPAASVIRLMKAVKTLEPEIFQSVIVQSCGQLPEEDVRAAKKAGVLEAFETMNPQPYENTLNCLGQADVLLLSSEVSRDEIIPAKFWDYLAAEKPVISLSQNPEIDEILKKTKTGRQFSLSETNEAAALLVSCFKARREGLDLPFSVHNETPAIRMYSAENTTAQLARLFDQLSNG